MTSCYELHIAMHKTDWKVACCSNLARLTSASNSRKRHQNYFGCKTELVCTSAGSIFIKINANEDPLRPEINSQTFLKIFKSISLLSEYSLFITHKIYSSLTW